VRVDIRDGNMNGRKRRDRRETRDDARQYRNVQKTCIPTAWAAQAATLGMVVMLPCRAAVIMDLVANAGGAGLDDRRAIGVTPCGGRYGEAQSLEREQANNDDRDHSARRNLHFRPSLYHKKID
jgi:hypothetical protein